MSEQLSIFAFILILATELDDGFAKYALYTEKFNFLMWKIRRNFVKTLKQINKDNFEKEHKNTEESLFDHKDDHNDDHNSIEQPPYWETFDVDENKKQFIENDDEKSIELSTLKIYHHEDSIGISSKKLTD